MPTRPSKLQTLKISNHIKCLRGAAKELLQIHDHTMGYDTEYDIDSMMDVSKECKRIADALIEDIDVTASSKVEPC